MGKLKYKNWIVIDKRSGLHKYFASINQAKLYYEELKGKGLNPKIHKNDKYNK